jgi:hypothetical protein
MHEIPRPGGFRRWPLFLIAAPAAVAVWSGWVGLGALAGFGVVHPLPGIVPGFQLNTAITLPVGVEAYGAYALGAWLAPFAIPQRARTFARRSAIGALLLGMTGQISYHLLAASHAARAPWLVVVAVSCMPVVTLGFGVALTHLLRAGEPEVAHAVAHEDGPDLAPETGPSVARVQAPGAAPAEAPVMASGPAPVVAQRQRPVRLSKDPDAERARGEYRKSVRRGQPLSDRALGDMYGRSRNWGAARIRECEGGPQLAARASG